ncbi:toxin-antitoxin system TumE family protein [Halostagnicola bangensis]
MADGDVVLDRNFEVDAGEGTRVRLFAVENSSEPGGYYYRFQYYAPDEGEQILRYDNAHDSDVGPHHRHEGDAVSGIEFDGFEAHVARFRKEVLQINAQR